MIKFRLATDEDPSVPYMTINILNKFLLIIKLIKSKLSSLTKIMRISSNSFWGQKEIFKFFNQYEYILSVVNKRNLVNIHSQFPIPPKGVGANGPMAHVFAKIVIFRAVIGVQV